MGPSPVSVFPPALALATAARQTAAAAPARHPRCRTDVFFPWGLLRQQSRPRRLPHTHQSAVSSPDSRRESEHHQAKPRTARHPPGPSPPARHVPAPAALSAACNLLAPCRCFAAPSRLALSSL